MVYLVILSRHNVTSLVLSSNGDKFAKDKGENKVNYLCVTKTYIMAAAYTTAECINQDYISEDFNKFPLKERNP
jgi:hypothetical protein